MRRSLAVGLASAVVVATSTINGVPAHAAPALSFGPCPEDVAESYPQLRCAELQVPLDYNDPTGAQLKIMVSKLPATDPSSRRGSLLVNPGGPGGGGIEFAGALSQALAPAVLDSYDLIGFDTRNTAHSTPITCVDPSTYWKNPLPDPDAPRTREYNWQRAQEYADGCQQRAGAYLPHLTTPTNARDMNTIRKALGEPTISFLGYSYGTYLGAVYGQLFPQRVDRMILDSAVNPETSEVWYRNNLNQDIAAQRRLGLFFDWIARYDRIFHLGTNREHVRAAWQALQDELRTRPHGILGPSELIDITFNALYGESSWVPLAEGISAYRHHADYRTLLAQVAVKDLAAENANAIYTAVECADAPWPAQREQWQRDSAAVATNYPLAAWYNSWTVAPCAQWPAPGQTPITITGADLPPILMLNSVNDVATPYAGARAMHRALPSSTLVTERDAGKHGVFAVTGNAEADRVGTEYLVHGTLPPEDISISGHPLPDPTQPERVRRAAHTIDLH